jgi:hypothetical protein
MARHRSIGLRLHLGKHGITYALTARVESDGRVRDARLTYGTLQGLPPSEGPHDILDALERVLADLRRRHGRAPVAGGGSGAPGGGGGRTHLQSVPDLPTGVSDAGEDLDGQGPRD